MSHDICRHCGRPYSFVDEGYMVRDDVWPGSKRGDLHIACLEAEIGRQLTPDDFTDCLLNLFSLTPPVQLRLGFDPAVVLAQRITGLDDPFLPPDIYDRLRVEMWRRRAPEFASLSARVLATREATT